MAPLSGGVFVEGATRVRDSELDMFGVVGHAVYLHYLQHARHEWLLAVGGDCNAAAESGAALAVSDLSISYKSALRSRDAFTTEVWVERVTGARVTLGQRIVRQPPASQVRVGLGVGGRGTMCWLQQPATTPN